MYLGGESVIGIIKELEKHKILFLKGKGNWSKNAVHYLASDNNPAIIKEAFEAVQIEKARS